MNNLAIIGHGQPATPIRTFDFKKNKTEVMDLETLKSTQKELYYGKPTLYHFEAIERALTKCQEYGLNYQIKEIFAAHNNNAKFPGTSVLEDLEKLLGEKAAPAHILRRVFTTIHINDFENEEMNTGLALAYHQDGIQLAIGPLIKICHNQCILSPERTASTYGKDKVSIDVLFDTVLDGWLRNFKEQRDDDIKFIERLKNTPVSDQQLLTFIGTLTAMRVAHDSSDKRLREKVSAYGLNSTQINKYTEDILKLREDVENLNGWHLYDTATRAYKPTDAEIPTLIKQNFAMSETVKRFLQGQPLLDGVLVEDAEFVEVEMVN